MSQESFYNVHDLFLVSPLCLSDLISYLFFFFFPAHSVCPHWCSYSFSNMPNSLPPHSLPPYYFFSLSRISFPFACFLLLLIYICSCVTLLEKLPRRPCILKHTHTVLFSLDLRYFYSCKLLSSGVGHILFFDLFSVFQNGMQTPRGKDIASFVFCLISKV